MNGMERMLETLEAYKQRTAFMQDSLPQDGGLVTNDSLREKVSGDGSFNPFYGDTVIFLLDNDTVTWLGQIQEKLYGFCGNVLSDRLDPATFHITLHDLESSRWTMLDNVKNNEYRVAKLIEYIRLKYPNEIYIDSRCLFSMVGTSIVMGFQPATNEDCIALMGLYEDFQSVVQLSYPLTLHATIAYYKPGKYNEGVVYVLKNALNTVGKEPRNIRLDLNKLNYATFSSMNSYSIVL